MSVKIVTSVLFKELDCCQFTGDTKMGSTLPYWLLNDRQCSLFSLFEQRVEDFLVCSSLSAVKERKISLVPRVMKKLSLSVVVKASPGVVLREFKSRPFFRRKAV